jgi:hypothetical protein
VSGKVVANGTVPNRTLQRESWLDRSG